jgi:pantetheine-phosphate adenylyltransferase
MRVILPGSYDPVTVGHLEVIKRAAREFEEVFVVIFVNPGKSYTFSLDDRVRMLMLATDELDNVMVSYSTGLVIDYMREHGIEKIIKGYRGEADLPWEKQQAEWNKEHGGYETELWLCDRSLSGVSSTVVRQALANGNYEEAKSLLPTPVYDYIQSRKG